MKRIEMERKRKANEARKKLEMNQPKNKTQKQASLNPISNPSKFGLCTCIKAKYCTIYNRSWFKI